MSLKENMYQNMIGRFDTEVFGCIYHLESRLYKVDFIKIFILLNKYYPSYTYRYGNLNIDKKYNEQIKWEDIVLKDIFLEEKPYIDLYFNIPVFVQIEEKINMMYTTENGIGISLEEDERFGFVFIIDIYPNVYLNVNYYPVFDKNAHKWNDFQIDQKLAAEKNREILASFLKELENLLKVEVNNYESLIFNKEHIYKYGFKDHITFFHSGHTRKK